MAFPSSDAGQAFFTVSQQDPQLMQATQGYAPGAPGAPGFRNPLQELQQPFFQPMGQPGMPSSNLAGCMGSQGGTPAGGNTPTFDKPLLGLPPKSPSSLPALTPVSNAAAPAGI